MPDLPLPDVHTQAEVISQALPHMQRYDEQTVVINGKRYVRADTHHVNYRVASSTTSTKTASLVDRGANGGMAGEDVRMIEQTL